MYCTPNYEYTTSVHDVFHVLVERSTAFSLSNSCSGRTRLHIKVAGWGAPVRQGGHEKAGFDSLIPIRHPIPYASTRSHITFQGGNNT